MPMRRVLLTGANNLTGSHILHHLLASNVSVRAVVGSREEAQALQYQYSSTNPLLLDFAIVAQKDLAVPGAFDDALSERTDPFDTVIHTVPAEPSEEADCLARFINLESDSLVSFLKSVRDVAPVVRRVIITASLTPFARWLVDPQVEQAPRSGHSASQRAAEIDSDYVLATSQASDNIVADSLWNWMRGASALFDLVYLTAPSIYGPSMRPLENSSDLEEANRRIWNICSNDIDEHMSSPPYGIDFFSDVRDLAFATVQSGFTPHAGNKRFFISAGTMPSGSDISSFLASRFPELGSRVRGYGSPPRRRRGGGSSSGEPPLDTIDTHLAASILGMGRYRRVEDTLTDLAGQILELHRRKDWRTVIHS